MTCGGREGERKETSERTSEGGTEGKEVFKSPVANVMKKVISESQLTRKLYFRSRFTLLHSNHRNKKGLSLLRRN